MCSRQKWLFVDRELQAVEMDALIRVFIVMASIGIWECEAFWLLGSLASTAQQPNPWPEPCLAAHSQWEQGEGPWRRACIHIERRTGADVLTHLLILQNCCLSPGPVKRSACFFWKTDHLDFTAVEYTSGGGRGGNTNLTQIPSTSWEMSGDQYHVVRNVCVWDYSECIPVSMLCVKSVRFMLCDGINRSVWTEF